MLMLNELKKASLNMLELKITPSEQQKAWQQAQNYSNPIARHNAYVNYVCYQTFLTWLSEWVAEESLSQPTVWPNIDKLATIWEFVNGTAIQLGKTRLVLIPSDDLDIEELRVPQEWVDIPNWVGDYYLAMEVNLDGDEDDCWVKVYGFTTHRQLKDNSRYDESDRTYSLPIEDLTENLTVMEITLGLSLRERVPELSNLSNSEATKLLQLLGGDTSLYSPRLRIDIPFAKWGALLDNDGWRQQMYDRRMGNFQESPAPIGVTASNKSEVKLNQWFQNLGDSGWQTVEEILDTLGKQDASLALEFRGAETFRDSSSSQQNAVPSLVELLQNSRDRGTQWRVAELLGRIGYGNSEAIAALTDLLRHTEDDDTRRQAAVSLGRIDPGNTNAGVRRAKIIDLGMLLGGYQVVLVVTLTPEADRKTKIHLRVYPAGKETYLPPNLELIVLDEFEKDLLSVQSRSVDNAIQLEFRGEQGDSFSVKVALGNVSVTEYFAI